MAADRYSLGLFEEKKAIPTPRWYQYEAEKAIYAELRKVRATLLVLATGLGKTNVFSGIAARMKGSMLVLAHREELVQQAKDRLELVTGERAGVEMADRESHGERLVVGSVDSVKQQKRLDRLGKDRFSLVVVDEAHHYVSKTYRRPLDFFNAKVLGVTATPDRGDRKALGRIFGSVAYSMDIMEGIEAGYLVPVEGQRVVLDSIDLSHVRETAGDLNIGELDEAMLKACEGIVHETLRLHPTRRGIHFFPGVRSAEYAMQAFNRLKPDSAVFISGATEPMLRKSIVEQFKKGRWQYLCNCMVATEGFDCPDVDLIGIGRPTKSRALYTQMAGRGTRVHPDAGVDDIPGLGGAESRRQAIAFSDKPTCTVLDFVGVSGQHTLCSVTDALGGSYTENEVAAAKKKVEEGARPDAALKAAREELKRLAAATQAQVKARIQTFDPFRVLHINPDDPKLARYGQTPASVAMVAALERRGIDARKMTQGEAKATMDACIMREKRGLATPKQLWALEQHGVQQINISKGRASKLIDALDATVRRQRRPIDDQQRKAILASL